MIPTLDKMAKDLSNTLNTLVASKGAGAWIKLEEPREPKVGKPKYDDEGRRIDHIPDEDKRIEFLDRPLPLDKDDIEKYLLANLFDADKLVIPKKLKSGLFR